MEELSMSFKTSSKMTSLKHNNRNLTDEEFLEPQHRHIDQTKIKDNIYIKQENLKEVYRDLFGKVLADYNAKQKRKDRMITDYYQHVKKSKTLDLQREFIVGIGDKAYWDNAHPDNRVIAGEKLKQYVLDFEKRHPHLYIYNAAVHLDEKGHPHAHFNVVPLATGYKNGLSMQPSFKKALQNEGYIQKGRHQLKAFKDDEVKILEGYFTQFGVKRKLVGTNNIKDMREYKEMVAQIEQEKQKLLSEINVEHSNLASESLKLKSSIKHQEDTLNRLESQIMAYKGYLTKQHDELNALEREIVSLRDEKVAILDKEIEQRQQQLVGLNQEIEEAEEEFEGIKELSAGFNRDNLPNPAEGRSLFDILSNAKKSLTGKFVFEVDLVERLRKFIGQLQHNLVGLLAKNQELQSEVWDWERSYKRLELDLEIAKSSSEQFDDFYKRYQVVERRSQILDKLEEVMTPSEADDFHQRMMRLEQTRSRGYDGPDL